ncbi:MAG: hypothetical protein JXM70_01210 [Pirellulales bacterium]|nr:hypothetical protein [Pirellulales bacterium]
MKLLRVTLLPIALAALATTVSGCGPGNPLNRQAVSGAVAMDGRPLESGMIEFTPHGREVDVLCGAKIRDGKYKIPTAQGLPPGKYLVRISSPVADNSKPKGDFGPTPGPRPNIERVPARYNTQSDIIVEVIDGQANHFDFQIRTKSD